MEIGIYNLHMQAKGGGEKRTLVLAEHLSRSHRVSLFVNGPLDVPSFEKYFGVDLGQVTLVNLNKGGDLDRRRRHFGRGRSKLRSTVFDHFRRIKSYELDLFINNSFCSNLPCPAPRGIYMCMFPYTHPRSAGTPVHKAYRSLMDQIEKRTLGCRISDFTSSYEIITANSSFTSGWVAQMWHRSPEVIYSVCDNMGPPAAKKKIILNVGRFFTNGSGDLFKRQDVLSSLFRELTDIHSDGWQLHFAGSVAHDAESKALVERLVADSKGLPVFFHFDVDLAGLGDLYRGASIYWHATGFGYAPGKHPRLQEHFGVTTGEAMSAGVVPVVINSGGQSEIVTDALDGYLCDDLTAVSRQSLQLIQDPCLLMRMGREAVLSSRRFSRAAFNERVESIIDRLMSTPVVPPSQGAAAARALMS